MRHHPVVIALVALVMMGCSGGQRAHSNVGRGWWCGSLERSDGSKSEWSRCFRADDKCYEAVLTTARSDEKPTCEYQKTAVCLRYSEPLQELEAIMCAPDEEGCEQLKRVALGKEHILLEDCALFE
ncbi:hypothetical protein [Haliangium sp.]|uniref:hypothetical protein n=1 Tax=Haliangium sp. TaxID=2663208 RepID=UPI003D0D2E85